MELDRSARARRERPAPARQRRPVERPAADGGVAVVPAGASPLSDPQVRSPVRRTGDVASPGTFDRAFASVSATSHSRRADLRRAGPRGGHGRRRGDARRAHRRRRAPDRRRRPGGGPYVWNVTADDHRYRARHRRLPPTTDRPLLINVDGGGARSARHAPSSSTRQLAHVGGTSLARTLSRSPGRCRAACWRRRGGRAGRRDVNGQVVAAASTRPPAPSVPRRSPVSCRRRRTGGGRDHDHEGRRAVDPFVQLPRAIPRSCRRRPATTP